MKTQHFIFLVFVFALMLFILEQPPKQINQQSKIKEVSTKIILSVGHTTTIK